MVSVLVLQVMVMVVSVTSVTRGLRGGLTSAPQGKGSCQYSGDWQSHQPSLGEAWDGALDTTPPQTQSRLLASAPTQPQVVIWRGPALTFKGCDHPLGWSAGQGVLQGIHTHFILGCYLEWTVTSCYEKDPARGETLLHSVSVWWSHVHQSTLTEI